MNILSENDRKKLSAKDSFLIQKTLYEDVKEMSEAEAKYFLMKMFEYVLHGVIPDLSLPNQRFVRVSFNRFKTDYDNDSMKWLESCKKKSDRKKEDWANRSKGKDKDADGNPLKHPKYPN